MGYKTTFRLVLIFVAMLAFSSCGSRRGTVKSTTAAAGAADAMARLKSRELYKFITDWTGVRYQLGGLDKKGIDCSGFALLLQRDIYGIKLPRRSRDQAEVIKSSGSLKEGDLIFFSFGGSGVDHVGVYLNNDYFVHASTTRGVIVDNLKLAAYQRAFVKAGPVKD
ncbi:NlpC/P60 family protein [Pedobacter sp. MC2016-14]|uniref:C40 family peptidase n=1 Tax=Pedobacter sp. MC2016-14 TaxID=2897327 RepID=UPI001E582315|nr:NlpC/P60 family protein [Pedobacter sp. MC2016-14]MCD0489645.1 NlpC/P60 family protein [Pedobacter sp. MC2016-14]